MRRSARKGATRAGRLQAYFPSRITFSIFPARVRGDSSADTVPLNQQDVARRRCGIEYGNISVSGAFLHRAECNYSIGGDRLILQQVTFL